MAWEVWMSAYLCCGVIWSASNMRSRFFRAAVRAAIEHRQIGWHMVGVVLGVFLWPLGVSTWAAVRASRLLRRRGGPV